MHRTNQYMLLFTILKERKNIGAQIKVMFQENIVGQKCPLLDLFLSMVETEKKGIGLIVPLWSPAAKSQQRRRP